MKIKILIIALLICANMYGQRTSGNQDIDNYFNNVDLTTLDPIEGFYQGETSVDVSAPLMGLHRTDHPELNGLITRRNGVLELRFSYGSGILTRIGESNAYNYRINANFVGGQKQLTGMLILNNGAWTLEGEEDQDGLVFRKYLFTFIKSYPTPSMYAEAYQKKQEQITKDEPQMWSGTGFALNNGYIATNYHVVDGAKSISVKGIKGAFNVEYKADVVAADKVNDLAIIKINDSRFSGFGVVPYRAKTTTSEVGEDIFVLGYPLTATMGDEIKLTTGVISSKTGFQGDVSLYQISAPIQPGNSGGPLFDGNGNLIGIVNAKHKGAENVSYAIKVSYLRNLMESVTSENLFPVKNSLIGQTLTGKVKNVKKFVFMITCSNTD